MNATSALVLILVLSFAADRLAKGLLFVLSLSPFVSRAFPDPKLVEAGEKRVRAARRGLILYTVVVGSIAGAAIYFFPEIRIIEMLSGPQTHAFIDIVVTVIVVMGGSDLVGRIVQVSGLGEGPAAPGGAGRNDPIEISGRLTLENPVVAGSPVGAGSDTRHT
jgi:hypothetical protein